MKCPYCGTPLGLEDEFCSFCGQPNPHAKKHQEDMKHYKKEFTRTQQDVYTKTRRFASLTVPLIILFVLFLLNIGGFIFARSGWRIGMNIAEIEISKNASKHRETMEEFIQAGDYAGLSSYYNTNSLYSVDEFDDYYAVVSVADSYFSIYRVLADKTPFGSYNFEPENLSSMVRSLTLNLDTLFNVEQNFSYNAETYLSEENMEIIHDIQERTKAVLIAYGGLTAEEAETLPDLSASRQEELLERRLGER
ncbi:MAG: zinc ribbon domain-containing protein [Clostridiales bacterium]|nr:zinc ribbon domain-containing protein [Clostridiales bacterium]